MEKNTKILLNKERDVESVNVDTQFNITIENNNKPLPINDIDTLVNSFEVFEEERKESHLYRFYGIVNGVICNPLYNDNIKIYEDQNGNPASRKISSSDIYDKDGWIGYFNDETNEELELANDNKSSLCEFFPFDPDYSRLRILDNDGSSNYMLKITYPYAQDNTLQLVKGGTTLGSGIPIIEQMTLSLNGNDYVAFKTPINHGLSRQDELNLYNFIDVNNDLALNSRQYAVFKLGDENGENTNRIFVLDIRPTDITAQVGSSTIKRVKNNAESEYYVRKLKCLTTGYTDYDIFPAAFGTNYYEDDIASFNFITDVDVKGLKDNLGRPLSELYLTIIKNDNDSTPNSLSNRYWQTVQNNLPTAIRNRFWTTIKGGYLTENNTILNYNVRSIGDTNYGTSTQYFTNPLNNPPGIDETDDVFDSDIVEYNSYELLEKSLENVYHRINTIYRENFTFIKANEDPPITVDSKREGYLYKPHSKIQIREFSSFIHPTVNLQSVFQQYNITSPADQQKLKEDYKIPDYATQISPNVYRWRDLLEIGEIDAVGSGVNYPFESGAHYMYLNNRFYWLRQDPPCNFYLTSESILIPQQKYIFEEMLTRPTYYDYTVTNLSTFNSGISASITDPVSGAAKLLDWNNPANPIRIDVRFFSFYGQYVLGTRDVPGACVNYNILNVTDIDENC